MGDTREKLIEYLTAVKKLEQERYTLECTIGNLNYKANQLGHPKQIALEQVREEGAGTHFGVVVLGVFLGFIVGTAYAWFGSKAMGSGLDWFGSCFGIAFSGAAIGAVIGLAIAIISITVAKARTNERNNQLKQNYKTKVHNDNVRVQKELKEQQKIRADIALLESTLNDVRNSLEQLYSIGILFPKYHWNLVAISEFLEYLTTGQCYGLVLNGNDDGAYKIFENRILMKQIISRLDDVLRNLEQIKRNQYMLYETMKAANNKIEYLTNSVNQSMNRMQQSIDVANYHHSLQSQCAVEIANMERYQYYRSLLNG